VLDEAEKKVYLFFRTDDDQAPILTADLSEAEMAAFRAHPDTFFGRVVKQTRNVEDPMDLFYFLLEAYSETPREKMLEFLEGSPDFEELQKLPVGELRLVYAERGTLSAMQQSQQPEAK